MPKIFLSNQKAIGIWKYVNEFKTLPLAGGIFDQPAKLMEQLWVISDQLRIEQEADMKLKSNK